MRRFATMVVVFGLAACGGDSEAGLGSGGAGGQSDASTGGGGGATGGSGGATGGSAGAAGATGGAAGATGGAAGATGGAAGAAGSGGATGGAAGTAGSGGSGGSGGTAGGGGIGGTGGGCGFCDFECCGKACINTDNDINNCGSCGNKCPGLSPYCDNGVCKSIPPCGTGTVCIGIATCCGTQCCAQGQLCCNVPGPVGDQLGCATPVDGTCPKGCTSCVCNSPDTPIATPSGERAIADLQVGDLVYSVDYGQVRVVPVQLVTREAAPNHVVVEARLASGALLRISPKHPTADGRTVGDLVVGDVLDGVTVVEVRRVPYAHSHTYDILPASSTGTYYAGGVLIGSTLAAPSASSSGATIAPASR